MSMDAPLYLAIKVVLRPQIYQVTDRLIISGS